MPDALQVSGSFVIALLTTLAITPLVIRLAIRTNFHDHPVGYKGHAVATPYLGGLAVVGGFLAATVSLSGGVGRFWPIVVLAVLLWAVGTVDDRVTVRPLYRVLVTMAAASALWYLDLGVSALSSDLADLVLTNVWLVVMVNAFNLMDNMDGAAATVVAVCGVGIAAVALISGDVALAAMACALTGACIGFLRFNLAQPARIFLGDGGSMSAGFLVGALLLAIPTRGVSWITLPIGVLLVGLPLLDVALVTLSRLRRGVPITTGGRDHLTHRLLQHLGSARAVAGVLACTQIVLGATAVALLLLGPTYVIGATLVTVISAGAIILLLETPAWRSPELAVGPQRQSTDSAAMAGVFLSRDRSA